MPLRLLERIILFDLLKTTVFSMVASSGLLMVVGAMLEASSRGIDPFSVLTFMPFLIAPTLPYTMPSCLLFACTMVYGSMASTNEITAVKAGGIHVGRVLWPGILLSLVMGAAGVYLVDNFIPACNRAFSRAIVADMKQAIYSYLKMEGAIVQRDFPYEIYVRNIEDDKMLGVVIKHRSGKGGYDFVAKASEATLRVLDDPVGDTPKPMGLELRLIDGTASSGVDNNVRFHDKTIQMPAPKTFSGPDQKVESLSFQGLWDRAAEFRFDAAKVEERLSAEAGLSLLTGDPEWICSQMEGSIWESSLLARLSHEYGALVHLRLAQSSATIPFALIGAPLAILFQRRDFLRTFFVCFLPIITLFYPAMILCFNVVKEDEGSQIMIIWAPLAILLAASVPFLRRVIRY